MLDVDCKIQSFKKPGCLGSEIGADAGGLPYGVTLKREFKEPIKNGLRGILLYFGSEPSILEELSRHTVPSPSLVKGLKYLAKAILNPVATFLIREIMGSPFGRAR